MLDDGHSWLRLGRPEFDDLLDPTFAARRGGRWNPPASWPTLYLNRDLLTVHAQVRHMFVGRGVEPDDLDDDAPIVLMAARLPDRQIALDVVTDAGVDAAGLPSTYPRRPGGAPVTHDVTQSIGRTVHDAGLDGVTCRSATGSGVELAWFPDDDELATALWPAPLAYGAWRHATALDER